MRLGTKVALAVAGVVLAQLALYGVYRLVEASREGPQTSAVTTAPPVVTTSETGTLVVEDLDGHATNLGALEHPTIVHFWATWCEPCREELPALLDLADAGQIRLIAVALDDGWAPVHEMLGGRQSPSLALGSPSAAKRQLGVRTLPVTFLVDVGGVVRLRADGARNWRSAEFVAHWDRAVLSREREIVY